MQERAKERKSKFKGRILKTSVTTLLIVWAWSVCCLDSETFIPAIVCAITTVILAYIAWANGVLGV